MQYRCGEDRGLLWATLPNFRAAEAAPLMAEEEMVTVPGPPWH